MTLSCLKIDFRELKNIKKDWWRYALILLNIFFISSLIIYFTRNLFDQNLFLGLLIATSVPCGISIVSFSIIFGGQPTKALITTTLAHLLAPILTPAIVWLFARQIINVNFLSMFILITKLIIIPLILAQIIIYFNIAEKIQKYVATSNTILVSLLNWGTIAPVATLISFSNKSFIISLIVVFLISILQIIFGILFGRNKEEDITWSISNFYKNTGLAAVITMTSFGPMATLGVVSYVIITNAILAPFQFWTMKKKIKT